MGNNVQTAASRGVEDAAPYNDTGISASFVTVRKPEDSRSFDSQGPVQADKLSCFPTMWSRISTARSMFSTVMCS